MSPVKLKAIRDDVIVLPIEDTLKTSGGLFLPDQSKERDDQGIVVAKGPQVDDEISLGDHVIFSGYAGSKISIENGNFFHVIPYPLILAKVSGSSSRLYPENLIKSTLTDLQNTHSDLGLVEFVEAFIHRLEAHVFAEGFEW